MAFEYFDRLPKRHQATYRRSDAVATVRLPDAAGLAPILEALRTGLAADDDDAVQAASRALVDGACARMSVPPPTVRVLSKRPSDATSELHGLYEREADGTALLRVWMRTAALERPAAFKTYLRTLLHELLHHLDFELLHLDETFHTEGFFRRESDLARQLLATLGASPEPRRTGATDGQGQLDLFITR